MHTAINFLMSRRDILLTGESNSYLDILLTWGEQIGLFNPRRDIFLTVGLWSQPWYFAEGMNLCRDILPGGVCGFSFLGGIWGRGGRGGSRRGGGGSWETSRGVLADAAL